jgi:beta-barrel assembly-enhancing protease
VNLRKTTVILSVLLTLHAGAACPAPSDDLPSIGDSSGSVISPEQEKKLGEMIMRSARQQVHIIDDPEINAYMHSLGYQLAAHSDDPEQHFDFFVVEDPSINAFALPGGFIGVHSGLIQTAESESELAAVLAHEMAHITQRHMARAYENAGKLSIPTAAALLAAILIGTRSSQAGQAAMAATTAGNAQMQINFTRSNEQEADDIGIRILYASGFDPRSMPIFFERLQRASRYYGDTLPEFLSTHPVTTTRIAESRNRAERYPRKTYHDSLAFQLMRARLHVLTASDPSKLVQEYAAQIKAGQYSNVAAWRYGYALSLEAAGHYDQARELLTELLAKDKQRIAYIIALAQVDQDTKNSKAALQLLSDALKLYPDDGPLTLSYVNALLEDRQPKAARDILQNYMHHNPPSPDLYTLLARAAGDAGYPGEAHEAQAEYFYLNGDTDSAIAQLEKARQTDTGDFYQSSRIDSRLAQLKQEVLEARKESR